MMKIAIYQKEDNYKIYENLQKMVDKIDWIDIEFFIFSHYKELITCFMGWGVDLIYINLDYQDEMDGMILAKNIHQMKKSCLVTLVTHNEKRFNEAFAAHVFQYIVYPYDEEFFKDELMRAIFYQMQQNPSYVFATTKGNVAISSQDIIYIATSYRDYKLCTLKGVYYGQSKAILEIKKALLDTHFFRIERSVIVNLAHVKEYNRYCIEMINDEMFVVSKKNFKEFRKMFVDYLAHRSN